MSIRYQGAIDDGLTEDAVCSLEQPAEAPDLTDTERSVLRFADLFATNHLAIDEGVYDDLRTHLSGTN
jgi:alkylhydroperoxidase family enzyme